MLYVCVFDTVQPAEPMKDCKIVILVNMPRDRYKTREDGYIESTDEAYESYMQYIATCPFIATLKERGVEVETKAELGCKGLEDSPGPLATWLYNFQGLEAGIVIVLPGDTHRKQHGAADPTEVQDREIPAPGLRAVKREAEQKEGTTTQTANPADSSAGPSELASPKPPGNYDGGVGESHAHHASQPTTATAVGAPPEPERKDGGFLAVSGRAQSGPLGASPMPEGQEGGKEKPDKSQSGLAGASPMPKGKKRELEESSTGQSSPPRAFPKSKGQEGGVGKGDKSQSGPAGASPMPKGKKRELEESSTGQSSPSGAFPMSKGKKGGLKESSAGQSSPSGAFPMSKGKKRGLEESSTGQPSPSGAFPMSKGKKGGPKMSSAGQSSPTAASPMSEKKDGGLKKPSAGQSSPTRAPPVSEKKAGGEEKSDTSPPSLSAASPVPPERKAASGESGSSCAGQSRLCWTKADVERYSPWDQTNIMVAGSRCLSLLILLVP